MGKTYTSFTNACCFAEVLVETPLVPKFCAFCGSHLVEEGANDSSIGFGHEESGKMAVTMEEIQ